MPKRFFPELESIRGLAAFAVLLDHWLSFGRLKYPIFEWAEACSLPVADLAVLTFFVLSGFVLTHVLSEDNGGTNMPKLVVRFWIRRVFRIYPLAIIVVLGVFIFFGSIDRFAIDLSRWYKYNDFSWHALIANLLLLETLAEPARMDAEIRARRLCADPAGIRGGDLT